MKTDRKALLWGTIIGVVLVTAMLVLAFEFPNFRMPFTGTQAEMFLVSALLIALLIASYRKLWKTPGFWALLLAFLSAHIALYWLVVTKITEGSEASRWMFFTESLRGWRSSFSPSS
jgi:uncharacterized membrane protein